VSPTSFLGQDPCRCHEFAAYWRTISTNAQSHAAYSSSRSRTAAGSATALNPAGVLYAVEIGGENYAVINLPYAMQCR